MKRPYLGFPFALLCAATLALPAPAASAGSGTPATEIAAQVARGAALLRRGSARDRARGLAWVIVAAASGDASAIRLRDRLLAVVRPETGIAAERLAFGYLNARDDAPDLVHRAATGPAADLRAALAGGGDLDAALASALRAGRYDLARLLLARGADPEAPAPSGLTRLAEAVRRDDLPAIALLRAHGASIFAPDASGAPLFQSDAASAAAKTLLALDARDLTRDEVRELQARLAAAGHDPGPIDGAIGRRTWAAFDALAAGRGLVLDGRNPNAALHAVRAFVPMKTHRDAIAKAIRSARAPVRATAGQPRTPRKTRSQIFFGGNLPG